MHDSPRFKLNASDLLKTMLFALMVGAAASLVWLMENAGLLDLGTWQPFVVAGIGSVLELVRRWLANNPPAPPAAKGKC